MVHAVRVPTTNVIYFIMGDAAAQPGWTIEPGAWLEVPVNAFYSMRGQRPEPEICQAVGDPLHYKIYLDPEQAEPDEWYITGLIFGGTFSAAAWREFAPLSREDELVPATVSEEEVAAYNEMLRNLPRAC